MNEIVIALLVYLGSVLGAGLSMYYADKANECQYGVIGINKTEALWMALVWPVFIVFLHYMIKGSK